MVQNVSGESLADTEGGDTEEDDDKFDSGFKRIEAAFSVWVEILESFYYQTVPLTSPGNLLIFKDLSNI